MSAEGYDRDAADAEERWYEQLGTLDGWEVPIPLTRSATLPSFPVEVLPRWLADFVKAEAIATQTPTDLAGMLTLGALATAAGGRVRVEPRPGWTEPTNLYLAVAMEPGNRKSPVFSAVADPLLAADKTMAQDSLSEILEAEIRQKIAKEAADVAAKKAATEPAALDEAVAAAAMAEAITVPIQPRLLADDVTVEALATLMAQQGGRISVLSDEGGIFDLIAGRYNAGQANFDLYLKAWSGTQYRVDRKGRPAEFIERPALTIGLAVQPEVLRSVTDRPGFRGRGLLGRFLYSLPLSPLGRRAIDPPPVPEEIETAYRSNMQALVQSLAEWVDPALLGFTEQARDALRAFETALEHRLGYGGDLAHVADWAGKLAGETVRVAALIYLATHLRTGWRGPVDGEAMKGAVDLGYYFIEHALAVFELMRADPLTDDATYVLNWLTAREKTTFIARELYSANRSRFPTADALTPVLAHLDDFGWVRPLPRPERVGPGRPPSQVWEITPLIGTHNQQNPDSADSADKKPDR
jgi:replicative DNA helicase